MPENPDAAQEATYVARLIDGDVLALRAIIALYGNRLTAIASITIGADDLARDAVQETFIQLWERRHALDPARGLYSLLSTIVRRRALDILRHEQMHGRLGQHIADRQTADGTGVTVNEGEQAIRIAELRKRLHAALDDLPPRCKEIFLLSRQAKLSYAEIESMLGISNATVRNQMSRAVQHLARSVAQWRSEEE